MYSKYLSFVLCILSISFVHSQNEEIGLFKETTIIAQGSNSGLFEPIHTVCFNKFFNQELLGKDFILQYGLNKVKYRKHMLIDIFLGKTSIKSGIINVQVKEFSNKLVVRYDTTEKEGEFSGYSPYIIIKTEKVKKPVEFVQNGKSMGVASSRVYIN